ncbi:MAG: site-specific integrase [Ignavibacteriaceae bacterium]|nr:site-specific integrase [Ignavibacteriaceae bacterium]
MQEIMREMIENMMQGVIRQAGILLADFVERYLRLEGPEHSESYNASIKYCLDKLIEYCGKGALLSSINMVTAKEVLAMLSKGAPLGINVYLRNYKSVFNTAKKWGYISENPFQGIKLKKRQKMRPEFLTEDEVRIVAKYLTWNFADIVWTAYYTGMRANEILSLRREDIMDSERMIRVGSKDFETKARKVRLVPVHYALWPIIERNIRGKNKGDFVFGKRKHAKYTVDCVSKKFKKACREAGLSEEIHFHSLRHSFGTNAIAKGAPITAVRDIMGHSSIQVTQIYAHTDERMLREAIEKL